MFLTTLGTFVVTCGEALTWSAGSSACVRPAGPSCKDIYAANSSSRSGFVFGLGLIATVFPRRFMHDVPDCGVAVAVAVAVAVL